MKKKLFFQVGLELRELLASVDRLIPYFPSSTHRQVSLLSKKKAKNISRIVVCIDKRYKVNINFKLNF